MNDQMQALARRAVACKHWRWMPGMRLISGMAIPPGRVTDDGYVAHNSKAGLIICHDDLPDLNDPATLGCLLALVREAWGDPSLCANDAGHYDLMFWHVYTHDRNVSVGCQTEAEALVAALEGAP